LVSNLLATIWRPKMQTYDRVRANTAPRVNWKIDEQISQSVKAFKDQGRNAISQRIQELEREWDIERVLETKASALAFAGLALGVTHNRKWLLIPGVVLPFLFLHAVQGWCPPLPVLRRLGVRTREEIDREKYALKALRGDFAQTDPSPYEAEQAAR
jgi:hypothetical protein